MLKQVYKIDSEGFLLNEIILKEFDKDDNCFEELEDNIIITPPPQGLIRTYETTRWTGTEWISTMTEAEYIATLPQMERVPTETEKLQEKINMLQSALDFIIINY